MAQKSNTDKGQPSGNTPMKGTGVPQNTSDDKMQRDEALTDQYTNEDQDVADGVRIMHPNRNVDKGHETGIGGY